MSATPLAILPYPIKPRFLPLSSLPLICFFAHTPPLSILSERTIFLTEESRWPMVSSTTAFVDAPGVLQTVTPLDVAASMSILSTPTPALMIIRREPPSPEFAEIAPSPILVALLITTMSKSAKDPDDREAGSW